MRQDERSVFDEALLRARLTAYPEGEYVGQESFMSAREIRALAVQAGVGAGTSVLDLCCGAGGPGRLITAEHGSDYLGVDVSTDAVELARSRAVGLPCRYEVAQVPPVPAGWFDVVLLLETLLAFPDKHTLVRAIASVLPPGGRFGLTVEEGAPLTNAERAAMPHADTVWLVPLPTLVADLRAAGMEICWTAEWSSSHQETAEALAQAFVADRRAISKRIGERALDDLVTAHRLWGDWLGCGRVRKFALVAERTADHAPGVNGTATTVVPLYEPPRRAPG